MSYILDALKKSEQERQANAGPSLQTIHQTMRVEHNGRGPLYYLLMLLVLLLTGAVCWLVWYQWQHQAVDFASVSQTTPDNTPSEKHGVPAENAADDVTPVPETSNSEAQLSSNGNAAVDTPPVVQDYWELPDNVKSEIPSLTFSFHVFSDNPERRTIIINNKRMREGDRVSDALVLREITPDGVIMSWNGRYFHLPVVEGWE